MQTEQPAKCVEPLQKLRVRFGPLNYFKTPIVGSYMSLVVRKPVFGVSDQVRHKPGSTAIEDG